MSRHTISRSLLAALLILCASLGAIEQADAPFDYLQLVEDSRAVLLLDSDFAPQEGRRNMTLRHAYCGDIHTTGFAIADSSISGDIEMRYDPDLRHAGIRLDSKLLSLRLASRVWSQRKEMDGVDGGVALRFRDAHRQASIDVSHWSAFEYSHAKAQLTRLFGWFALDLKAEGAAQQHDHWLAEAGALVPLGDWLIGVGAQTDDQGDIWPAARLQWRHNSNLLAKIEWSRELDTPPLDSLFTDETLAWRIPMLDDVTLDSRPQETLRSRVEWAFGDWRGDIWRLDVRTDSSRVWVWSDDEFGWAMIDDNAWRSRMGAQIQWKGVALTGEHQPGSLRGYDARWRYGLRARQRIAPYLFAVMRVSRFEDQLVANELKSYWTSGADVVYSGPFKIDMQLGVDRSWRRLAEGEADHRWSAFFNISYRQAEHARYD